MTLIDGTFMPFSVSRIENRIRIFDGRAEETIELNIDDDPKAQTKLLKAVWDSVGDCATAEGKAAATEWAKKAFEHLKAGADHAGPDDDELREQYEDVKPPAAAATWAAFPLSVLPAALRQYVAQSAKALGCDAAQVAVPVLATLAAAVGNARRIELRGGWAEPAVVWAAIILPSGCLKSPALEAATWPLDAQQHELVQQYKAEVTVHRDALAEWEAQTKKSRGAEPAAPVCPRLIVSDTTLEALCLKLAENPRGLLAVHDELFAWFKGFDQYRKGGDASKWLSLHRAGRVTQDRKTGDVKLIYVPRAFVSLVGTIQPATLRRALLPEHRESGLAARLLLTAPPVLPRKWTEATVSAAAKAAYADVVRGLLALPMAGDAADPEPVDLPLTVEAKSAFIEFYDAHGAELDAMAGGDLAAAWSKLEGYAARLALIVHLVRVVSEGADPDAVDATSMAAGVALTRWFAGETERVYEMLGSDPENDARRALYEMILTRHGGRITARELAHAARKYRAAGAAEAALGELADAGYGEWRPTLAGAKGGRPGYEFMLTKPREKTTGNTGNGNETPRHDSASEGIVTVTAVTASKTDSFVTTTDASEGGAV